MYPFVNNLSTLPVLVHARTRSITAENPNGEKGRGGMAASKELGAARKGSPCISIPTGATVTLADISGPGVIQHLWMTVTDKTSESNCFVYRDLVLRFYWDGEETPSIECPLGDFFCFGHGQGAPFASLPMAVNPNHGFNCYFPMPFRQKARITLENQNEDDLGLFFYQIDYCLYDALPDDTAYFHAQWRRENPTRANIDYTILDGVTGRGHYVGTYLAHTSLHRGWWGEGEIKFYLDGDQEYPTICGTGTEDYFGGAWSMASYPDGKLLETCFSSPFSGYNYYSSHDTLIRDPYFNDDIPPIRGVYRWHIMDPVRFEQDLRVTIQQIGRNNRGMFNRQDDVASVAYWYQTEPHGAFPPLPPRTERWPR